MTDLDSKIEEIVKKIFKDSNDRMNLLMACLKKGVPIHMGDLKAKQDKFYNQIKQLRKIVMDYKDGKDVSVELNKLTESIKKPGGIIIIKKEV